MESASLTRDRPGSGIAARAREVDSDTRGQGRVRRPLRVLPRRLPGLPDVPELRLLLLAAVGPRGARPAGAVLRGLPRADRAPAGDRGGRAAVAARPGRRPRVGGDDARHLPVAGVGDLPARARRVHAADRRARGAAAADPLRLRVPRRARLHRRARTWRWWCGRRCWRRRGPSAAGRSSCCSALAGLLRPEAWILSRPLLPVDEPPARRWGERARYAAMAAAAPLVWAAVDFAVTGDPLFSLHYTSSSAEDLGRQRTLGEIPSALPEFFSSLVKLPVLLAALLGIGVARVGGAAAARSCRSCCCSAGSARSC